MKDFKFIWVVGLVFTLALIIVPIVIFVPWDRSPAEDPWDYLARSSTTSPSCRT